MWQKQRNGAFWNIKYRNYAGMCHEERGIRRETSCHVNEHNALKAVREENPTDSFGTNNEKS